MKKLWRVFSGFLTLIGFVVVALAVIGVWSLRGGQGDVPEKIILAATLNGTPEDAPDAPAWMAQFVGAEPTLRDTVDGLHHAAKDPRVTAFALHLGAGDYNWADTQELRDAIAVFRASGKRAYVFAESYGELSSGMAAYYLASAFDEIWLQPVGTVAITGVNAEVPYVKKTLDRIGITSEIIQKGDYKTAPESALREHMSDESREMVHGMLSSMMTDFFEGVSAGRDIPIAQIGALVDGAPYTALEAKERNLVTRVGYMDELTRQLIPNAQKDVQGFVHIGDYLSIASSKILNKKIKKDEQTYDVALFYISGLIVPNDGYGAPGFGGPEMASASDIAGGILDASQDDAVGAIVLRVDSPGGSPGASETIRRAVEVARKRGKYVVVSMGSEAASGGYWVSVDAERIFAQPGTLTGSIGVFGGKNSFAGLWDKLDVNWDSVRLGGNAGVWSPNAPFNEAERTSVSHMLDDVYDAFIDRVAKGRHFAPEIVESMAQGRVWTGRQAKERGLIDEIGGLRQALEDVAKKLGVDGGADNLNIVVLPAASSPFDGLMAFFSMGARIWAPLETFLQGMVLAQHPELGITRAQNF